MRSSGDEKKKRKKEKDKQTVSDFGVFFSPLLPQFFDSDCMLSLKIQIFGPMPLSGKIMMVRKKHGRFKLKTIPLTLYTELIAQ